MESVIPKEFMDRYGPIVDDKDAFHKSLLTPLKRSFRINPIKADHVLVKNRIESYGIKIKQTHWYDDAFFCENPEIGYTLENFMGHIYIQELASMLPPLLVRKELKKAELVLDGCAAPGSKTSQIGAFMQNHGIIVANDINYERIAALKFNLEKLGVTNSYLTCSDFRFFPKEEYDIVFVDAPCSADGTTRKKPQILSNWKEDTTYRYVDLQYQLIKRGFELIKEGGTLIYSTCSMSPAENEQVVDWLLKKYPRAVLEPIDIPNLKISSGIAKWNDKIYDKRVSEAARIWPHSNDTDGFFIARITK